MKKFQLYKENMTNGKLFMWAFCAALFTHIVLLLFRLGEPILGAYKFRQTQTAISAYWMEKDGFKLFYETPVLGSPWSIPFEFPLFQWIVAFLGRMGVPIDSGARLVSFSFFVGCLYLIAKLCDHFKVSNRLKWIFLFLLTISPLYIYWSAASMIESAALFFALGWLLFYIRSLTDFSVRNLILCLVFGILAALEKITTFPSFVLLGFLVTLGWAYGNLRTASFDLVSFLRKDIAKFAVLPFLVLIPIFVTLQWVHATDAIKAQNLFGETITSARLSQWNYGTLRQRLKIETWIHIIGFRGLNHILGYGWLLLPLVAAAYLRDIKGWILLAFSSLIFLSAPLIFWNLHIVHYYYQYSNGLFLIFGVAIVFDRAMTNKIFGLGSLTLFAILSAWSYADIYGRLSVPSSMPQNHYVADVTDWVKTNTPEDSGMYLFGHDWSSHMHFYSERKGIAFKNSVTYEQLDDMLVNPEKYLGGMSLGAIVVCANLETGKFWLDKNNTLSRRDLLREHLKTRDLIVTIKGCSIYN